jgi:hypothetical protein
LRPEDRIEAIAGKSAGQTGKPSQRWRSEPWSRSGDPRPGRNGGDLMNFEIAGYNKRGFETFGHWSISQDLKIEPEMKSNHKLHFTDF